MAEIDKNFMSTYAKVATHDGDDEPIQIWAKDADSYGCLLYTSPSPRDRTRSRMPSSA